MVKNYLTRAERAQIDSVVDSVLLSIQKSYPDNSLIDIIQSAIPNVQIQEGDFNEDNSIRGVIYWEDANSGGPKIIVQKNLSPSAKTLTLAHEFGHYMLGHPGDKNYYIDKMEYDGSMKQQYEAQAQYFAATLLMPTDKFVWLAQVLDEEDLAKRFGVSAQAVRVRKKWIRTP